MREENIRFRETEIRFETHAPRKGWDTRTLLSFDELEMRLNGFVLETKAGKFNVGEVVGVVGPNSTGKTTFVKMLAGIIEPTKGELESKIKVSYKPQYLKPDFAGTVKELFFQRIKDTFSSGFFNSEVSHPLNLKSLLDSELSNISGG
jgi:ATP-binding cassette subfamily E protein 1